MRNIRERIKLVANQEVSRETVRICAVVATGIVLRLLLPLRGHNFDVESYKIVAAIVRQGGNVYELTRRYNYAPVWFNILHALDVLPWLSGDPINGLRWKIAIFLTVIDVGIFAFLLKRYSFRVAALFFLNPISIIISGYHNQFDNFAVLTGLLSVWLFERENRKSNRIWGLIGLGLSLCIKHILFFYPLWLAFKERHWPEKIRVVLIPYLLFLGSFVWYLPRGEAGIRENVFSYESTANGPFWSMVLPFLSVPRKYLFFATLLVVGLYQRKKAPLESLHTYFISLIVFSSAITNQYLAICVPSIAVSWNWVFGLYTVFGTITLLLDADGLHLPSPWQPHNYYKYDLAILFLAIGLLIATLRRKRSSNSVAGTPEEAKSMAAV
jgi:hypothetical protein